MMFRSPNRVLLLLSVLPWLGCAAEPERSLHGDYTQPIRGTDVAFDMVWVPEGGFWIGRTEVTWDEYLTYCDFGERESVPPGVDAVSRPSKPLETFPYDRDWGTGRRPAVGMSWNAAKQYCRWLSLNTGVEYRLPTEAEWRLACGARPASLADHAWFAANSGGRTHPVAGKLPNAHGLFDVLGNACEYTNDPFDPKAPEWAALRGGSYADPAAALDPDAREAFDELWILRDPNVPPGVWWVPDGARLGFRVVRVPDAEDKRQPR